MSEYMLEKFGGEIGWREESIWNLIEMANISSFAEEFIWIWEEHE